MDCVANTLWILRSPRLPAVEGRPQNDTPYFDYSFPKSAG